MQKCISDQFTSAPSTVRCSASRPHPVGVRGSGEGGGPPRTPPRPNQKKCYLVCRFKLLPGLPVAQRGGKGTSSRFFGVLNTMLGTSAEVGSSSGSCDTRRKRIRNCLAQNRRGVIAAEHLHPLGQREHAVIGIDHLANPVDEN